MTRSHVPEQMPEIIGNTERQKYRRRLGWMFRAGVCDADLRRSSRTTTPPEFGKGRFATLVSISDRKGPISSHHLQVDNLMVAVESTRYRQPVCTLRDAILVTVSDSPHRLAVKHVVECCHRFALPYLFNKAKRGRLQLELLGLSLNDLALDSIAELFRRDDTGVFPLLRDYFDATHVSNQTDRELQVALRRLVFSKVNESLFRRYREADPNLGKIIRNIKDAVAANPRLRQVRRGNRDWVRVLPSNPNGQRRASVPTSSSNGLASQRRLAIAPPEVIEAYFSSTLDWRHQVRDLTTQLIEFFQQHPYYASEYPLVNLAMAMRASFAHVVEVDTNEDQSEAAFLPFEVEEAIQGATDWVEEDKRSWYVDQGKVSAPTYKAYFAAIRAILEGQYVYEAGATSNYEVFTQHLPGLSKTAYQQEHRNVLEYMVKLARTRTLQRLGSEA